MNQIFSSEILVVFQTQSFVISALARQRFLNTVRKVLRRLGMPLRIKRRETSQPALGAAPWPQFRLHVFIFLLAVTKKHMRPASLPSPACPCLPAPACLPACPCPLAAACPLRAAVPAQAAAAPLPNTPLAPGSIARTTASHLAQVQKHSFSRGLNVFEQRQRSLVIAA